MNKFIAFIVLICILITSLANPAEVHADGIIIPDPPICTPTGCVLPPLPLEQLQIKYHHVEVNIKEQIATTRVDQIFYNPNDYIIEGTYVFPLPVGATVSKFVLWVDGKPIEGKVLNAEEARQLYEQTVRQMADPALLEYIGRGAVQASIYPIPPLGERRIELEYQQVLTAENGLIRYVYPLNTEKFSVTPLESVIVQVNILEEQPVRAVYSPSHSIDVVRKSNQEVSVSYEAVNSKPDTDFILLYSIGENEAFHLMTTMGADDPGDQDGYFLMLLAPKIGGNFQPVAKDIILVLDRSGSMEGEKFQQARSAMAYILRHLAQDDRFFLLAFSSGSEAYSESLVSASQAEDAIEWINQMGASGSTDIDLALMQAAKAIDPEKPTYIIFLTDGLPTRGVTDSNQILINAAGEMPDNVRLFPFGVGYDVDTFLLDSLAQDHHGLSTYVLPGEQLDERLSAFYEKISTPVLTDLEIDFGGQIVYDVLPNPLPDLFEGTQVIITGRYTEEKTVEIKVKGLVNGIQKVYEYPEQKFSGTNQKIEPVNSQIPRLWATRKIGYLLNQIRLLGPDEETIEQVVRLSLKFGIVTPYTSYLVLEDMPMGSEAQREAAQDAYQQAVRQPTQLAFGEEAVQKAVEGGAMAQAEQPAELSMEQQSIVRQAGGKTFMFKDGIWVDTIFDPEKMELEEIGFLGNRYLELIDNNEGLAAAFALGVQVIVVYQGRAIQVVNEGNQPTQVIQPLERPTEARTIELPKKLPEIEKNQNIYGVLIGSGFVVFVTLIVTVIVVFRKKRK